MWPKSIVALALMILLLDGDVQSLADSQDSVFHDAAPHDPVSREMISRDVILAEEILAKIERVRGRLEGLSVYLVAK